MSKKLDKVFQEFEDVFVARQEEIKEYLLKYKKESFMKRDVLKVERIDATDRLKTSGFRSNLSMWQNFYRNIIVSSCIKVKGREKRYDYKFFFKEEKLSSDLLEKVERAINEATKLKQRRKYEKALKKIDNVMDLISDQDDEYIETRLTEVRQEIVNIKEEYNKKLQQIRDLERNLEKERASYNFDNALNIVEKIIESAKSIRDSKIKKQYEGRIQDFKQEKIEHLQRKVEDQRREGNYEDALKINNEIIELAEENNFYDIRNNAYNISEEIKKDIERDRQENQVKEEIASLEQKLEENRLNENYEDALKINNEIIELAKSIDNEDAIDKFISIHDKISIKLEEKRQRKKKKEKIDELRNQVEERQKLEDLEGIIELSNRLITLSTEIKREDLKAEFQALINDTRNKIEDRNKRIEVKDKISSLSEELRRKENDELFEGALETSSNIIELAQSIDDKENIERYNNIRDGISKKLEQKRTDQLRREKEEKISQLRKQIEENQKSGDLEGIIELSNEIILLSTEIERDDIKKEFQVLLEETKRKLEEQKKKEEEEQLKQEKISEFQNKFQVKTKKNKEEAEKLLNKAKSFENMIGIEEDILPTVEEYTPDELIGDVSADVNQMIDQLNSLLDKHRVEVKETVKSESRLISASGETATLEEDLKVKEVKEKKESTLQIESGFQNPFDEMIKDAIVSDLIPYNYEITDIEVNKKRPEKLPNKTKLKDGLEVRWELQNVPPQEKVDIQYNLRKRISRTIIFLLKDQLKIIKTHTNLKHSETSLEGMYDVNFPFSNSYERALNGVVIEDIIPLYYVHDIKQPTWIVPQENKTDYGNLVKWNMGELEPTTINYYYKLLEIYKYEELKASIYHLDKEAFEALKNDKIDKSNEKYNEILKTLGRYI